MAAKRIDEIRFREYALCPMRLNGAEVAEAPELKAARAALRTVLYYSWVDPKRAIPLAKVRESVEHNLRLNAGDGLKNLRMVPRIARRLHDLAAQYTVLQPITNYSLPFGRLVVTGDYAVLHRPRRRNQPFILRLRYQHKRASNPYPDVLNLTRWLHLRTFEPAMTNVTVLNYAIDVDEQWTESYTSDLVPRVLQSIANNAAEERIFPSAGKHCTDCSTKACMEVFCK